jgi:hypothetical protein
MEYGLTAFFTTKTQRHQEFFWGWELSAEAQKNKNQQTTEEKQ